MPWTVPYGRWLIRAQMEDMNQRRRGEETINLPNGNPLWGAWASPSQCSCSRFYMWPPSLNSPQKCPHWCRSHHHWRAQDAHQKTPKPHNKLLAQRPPTECVGATWRWCGFESGAWETWCSQASPAVPCTCVVHTREWHPAWCGGLLKKQDLWCGGRLCVGSRAETVCLLSACEAVAKVKISLLWHRLTSTS